MTTALNDPERERIVRRNIRRTAAVLWLTVASIFLFVLAKYYWLVR
jgi:hypothetical protein